VRNLLGRAYLGLRRYPRAESLQREALSILEGLEPPNDQVAVAVTNTLAFILYQQGRYSEAEVFWRRSLNTIERNPFFGPIDRARALHGLAADLNELDRSQEAQTLLEEAGDIVRNASRVPPGLTALIDANLASSFRKQGNVSLAEPLLRSALRTLEALVEKDHASITKIQIELAFVLFARGLVDEGEELYKKGLAALERDIGSDHPATKKTKDEYTRLRGK
jgi:tetratricopeptide (TPR) repeat protein